MYLCVGIHAYPYGVHVSFGAISVQIYIFGVQVSRCLSK